MKSEGVEIGGVLKTSSNRNDHTREKKRAGFLDETASKKGTMYKKRKDLRS